jgi:hypothetical protein
MNRFSANTPAAAAAVSTSGGALPGSGRVEFGQATASAMSMKWSALHDAAVVIDTLAGLAAEPMSPEIRNYPAVMRDAGGSRRDLAEQGIEDILAVMEFGLAALLAAHARGAAPGPAALSLHQEFLVARNALLTLAPPPGRNGQRRFA